jgi:putative colanic acid biosynthesis acetyltransferase WcaF
MDTDKQTGMDVTANRKAQKWTAREKAGRIIWALVHPLFAWSPRPFWSWRRQLLRLFGAQIASEVHIYPTVRVTVPWNLKIGPQSAVGDRAILYALGPISLGSRVTISQGSHLCAGTHEWRAPDRPLLKPPIVIDDDAWICADAFIGPGVTVGKGAIVGARAVAMKDVSPGSVVIGNPARELKRDKK